jgi:hypothetical protein
VLHHLQGGGGERERVEAMVEVDAPRHPLADGERQHQERHRLAARAQALLGAVAAVAAGVLHQERGAGLEGPPHRVVADPPRGVGDGLPVAVAGRKHPEPPLRTQAEEEAPLGSRRLHQPIENLLEHAAVRGGLADATQEPQEALGGEGPVEAHG